MLSIILSCIVFFAALTWIAAEIVIATAKLQRFFRRLFMAEDSPGYAEATIQQMYDERKNGSDYMKSQHAIKERR